MKLNQELLTSRPVSYVRSMSQYDMTIITRITILKINENNNKPKDNFINTLIGYAENCILLLGSKWGI
jgi:hypothetical protein